MIEHILLCYIVAHGYFDVLLFKDKKLSTLIYIGFSALNLFWWKLFPSITLYFLIYHTYNHFNNDIKYIYPSKNIYLPTSIFIGTMIGASNFSFWLDTLQFIGFNVYELYIFMLTLIVTNSSIVYSGIYNYQDLMLHLYSIIYGYLFGPYYGILIYMIFHSTLSLYKTVRYHFPHNINNYINTNKNNIYYLIALSTLGNYIILYSNILSLFNIHILIDIAISILLTHIHVHNYNILNDINPILVSVDTTIFKYL
jgi:hypothetical protein